MSVGPEKEHADECLGKGTDPFWMEPPGLVHGYDTREQLCEECHVEEKPKVTWVMDRERWLYHPGVLQRDS